MIFYFSLFVKFLSLQNDSVSKKQVYRLKERIRGRGYAAIIHKFFYSDDRVGSMPAISLKNCSRHAAPRA